MKLPLLAAACLLLLLAPQAQNTHRARPLNPNRNLCAKVVDVPLPVPGEKAAAGPLKSVNVPMETLIGDTKFDLQTNSTCQQRIYRYPNGSLAATWTMGYNDAASYPDRGTAYTYSFGNQWAPFPLTRIETVKTGWPSYAPLGDSGEIVCAHSGTSSGLILNKREGRMSGSWTQFSLAGPSTNPNILWPRMTTRGDTIHLIALTAPVANAGTMYNSLDGALLYYRSINAGASWDKLHVQPTGLTSANYRAFGGDQYAWAEPRGDTLAFVMGDDWYDVILMKSVDGGDTWTRTVVFQHPYPFFNETTTLVTDTPWVCDGSLAVALDHSGNAHLAFGLMRVLNTDLTDATTTYLPFTDGLVYWNETMPPLSSLNDDSLYTSGNLIAWMLDLNGNGVLDFVSTATTSLGLYYMSLSSQPQIHVDDQDNLFLLYSGVREGAGNGLQNYRHIYGRGKIAGGYGWDTLFDITGSLVHNYHECVFPSLSPRSDASLHFMYQYDTEPGLSVRGDMDPAGLNDIVYVAVPKTDFLMSVGTGNHPSPRVEVGQNYPNPFSGLTRVPIALREAGEVRVEVRDLMGRLVWQGQEGRLAAGEHSLGIPAPPSGSGVYFYTVHSGKEQATRRMVVR
ncbi:MAG TPA: T9SS type A sorting domain-containing protein [Bacteroidales bacterium]|nr:T9SS type A sorting domain-containing protein [Bacteroidales bacterium]